MIDDKNAQAKADRARDAQLQREQAARELRKREEEEATEMRRREQFRQEATAHWEDSKKLKAKQKEGKYQSIEERLNEEVYRNSMKDKGFNETQIKEVLLQRREKLRQDLKQQIAERKAVEDQLAREQEALPNTGLRIGDDYVNRFERFKDMHIAALKEQVDEKGQRSAAEKQLEREMQAQYLKEMREYQEAERERRQEAERLKSEQYRSEMEGFKHEREEKKQREMVEKQREMDTIEANRALQREEDARRQEAAKARESAHITDLKDQIENSKARKVACLYEKAEEADRKNFKSSYLKPEVKCRLYDCTECHRVFPPSKLNKVKHDKH